MRIAIISDIHANLIALEAVLADIAATGADQIVCLGDICGYGPQPNECIDLVRTRCAWSLRGNHDEALFSPPFGFSSHARAALEWQRALLQPTPQSPAPQAERWNWLRGLTAERLEHDILYVHASPRDSLYEYVLAEDFRDPLTPGHGNGAALFGAIKWLCFCGHSHRPGIVGQDFKWHVPADIPAEGMPLPGDSKTIVNVGSVGQPRDGNPAACFGLLELGLEQPPPAAKTATIPPKLTHNPGLTETHFNTKYIRRTTVRISLRRVPYDVAQAQARFRAVPQLPAYNAERLATGK